MLLAHTTVMATVNMTTFLGPTEYADFLIKKTNGLAVIICQLSTEYCWFIGVTCLNTILMQNINPSQSHKDT
jgi:hypothetical protein